MARPKKTGLSYFPLDADIFEDDKLFDVQNEYGPVGEIIYMRLLCLVYKNGYYYKFDSMEKLSAMLIKSIGNRWINDKNEIARIIEYLAECGLFSKELFKEKVLTSKGIQLRYFAATSKRRCGISEYNLVKEELPCGEVSAPETEVCASENGVSVCSNPQKEGDNPTKKSKENKNKQNKTKQKKREKENPVSENETGLKALPSRTENYGYYRNVPLTDMELKKLKEEFPNDYRERIERLSEYTASSGKIYNSCYATIRSWARKEREKPPDSTDRKSSFSIEDLKGLGMFND